jgi:hypothetical protein
VEESILMHLALLFVGKRTYTRDGSNGINIFDWISLFISLNTFSFYFSGNGLMNKLYFFWLMKNNVCLKNVFFR